MASQTKSGRFHNEVKWVVFLAQFFGLFPVQGITGSSCDGLRFVWCSKTVLLSGIVIISSIFVTVMALYRMCLHSFSLHSLANFVFNANSVIGSVVFFNLARKWPKLMMHWSKVEQSLANYTYQEYLGRKFNIIVTIFLSAAAIEHILSIVYVYEMVQQDNIEDVFKRYFLTSYPHIFNYLPFSIPLAIFVVLVNICSVFSWNFLDTFLMILSISLSFHLRQISKKAISACKMKVESKSYWIKLRADYNKISILCKRVNKKISSLILVSFGTNMFFIMSQLYSTLDHRNSSLENVYSVFSFALLISRTIAVTLCGSKVNDECKKPLSYLLSVHSGSYNQEVERFAFQIHYEPVALSGYQLFTITRGLLFSMAGTIVTYELFLIQSNVTFSY